MLYLIVLVFNILIVYLIYRLIYRQFVIINNKKYLVLPLVYSLLPVILSIAVYFLLDFYYEIDNTEPVKVLIFIIIILPFFEELFKFQTISFINQQRPMKYAAEGLFIGGIVGLVFALFENIYYTFSSYFEKEWIDTLILLVFRGLFTLVGHPVFSSINGSAIATSNFTEKNNVKKTFLTSYLLHAGWNFAAFSTLLLGNNKLDVISYFAFIIITSIILSVFIKEINYVKRFDNKLIKQINLIE